MRRCFSMLCITLETKLQLIQAPLPRFRSRAVFPLSIAWMAAVCHAATPDGRPSSFDTSSQPQSPSKAARARGNVGRLYRILMPMNGRQSGTENAGASCTIWIPMIGRGDGWGPDLELCSGRAILCRIARPEIRPWTNHVRISLIRSALAVPFCRKCGSAVSAREHWRNHQRQGSMKSSTTTPGAAACTRIHAAVQDCSTYPRETRPQAQAADTATVGSAIIVNMFSKRAALAPSSESQAHKLT